MLNRKRKIARLARLHAVDATIWPHHSGWSARIDGRNVTRHIKGRKVDRWRTEKAAEKVLLDELEHMVNRWVTA